ncbi:hypothetical protein T492DRAFT_833953 [Pavlovales sp. CCMP2436]|nr:hypothetical protein T492DRAFT_833953 [Pavlovales sp. CCMP2436]
MSDDTEYGGQAASASCQWQATGEKPSLMVPNVSASRVYARTHQASRPAQHVRVVVSSVRAGRGSYAVQAASPMGVAAKDRRDTGARSTEVGGAEGGGADG